MNPRYTTHIPATRRVSRTLTGLAALSLAGCMTLAITAPSMAADEPALESSTDYAVLVRGQLFSADLTETQAAHDDVAAGGEEAARAAGDFAHLAALSTTLLGGTEGEFLGLDRWQTPEAIEAFYADPALAEAFGALFAEPPTIEVFERQADWHTWGELPDPGAGEERWLAVVRGQLAEADPAAAQQAHDAVAAGGQAAAEAAGDIAHIVFTGLADSSEFLAIDVWQDDAGVEAVYGDPEFGAAFASLFAEPPSLTIYRTTDWHQW